MRLFNHTKNNVSFILAVLLVLFGGAAIHADRAPGDINTLKPGVARTDTIVPDRWLQSWDPVTIFFKSAKGPTDPKIADNVANLVTMTPAHPGGWRWLNSKTLQFVPVEPWPPFSTFTINAGRASAELHTVLPVPEKTVPVHGDIDVPQLETIELTFPMEINADSLAEHISLNLWTAPMAEDSPRQQLDFNDFQIKQLQKHHRDGLTQYLLTLNTPIADNTRVKMQIDLTDIQSDKYRYILDFTTAQYFTLLSVGARSDWMPINVGDDLDTKKKPSNSLLKLDINPPVLNLRFSAVPDPVTPSAFWDFIHLTPDVAGLKFTVKDRVLELSGEFEPDIVYTATLRPTPLVQDNRGRPLHLGTAVTVPFIYRKPAVSLRWNQGIAVLERYGARMLPVNGRGNQLANLRIYKIDPLDKTLWPFPREGVTTKAEKPPAEILTRSGKYHDQTWYTSQWDLARALRTMGSPVVSELVELPLNSMGRTRVYGLDVADYLRQIDGVDAPGTYLAGIEPVDSPGERHWMRFQVTDLAVTTIEDADEITALVTSLNSGQPLANARVIIEGYQSSKWVRIIEGKTDAMGVTVLRNTQKEKYYNARRIRVERGSDIVVFNPDNPPKLFRHGHWSQEGDWIYSTVRSSGSGRGVDRVSHTFTERPVYKPGDPVHIRGWLRRREFGKKMAIQTGSVELKIRGPGDMQWVKASKLSNSGGFYVEFQADEAPAGSYNIDVIFLNDIVGHASFRMEDYRLPTFEVLLHGQDTVPLDAPFDVSMTATYYAGGVMVDRPVDWRVMQHELDWSAKSLPGYKFASDDLFSGRPELNTDVVLEKNLETDATGGSSITIDPLTDPSLAVRYYSIEATVTGVDDQTVTSVKRVEAMPAFLLGMKAPRVVEPGDALTAELVVIDTEDTFLEGREILVRLIHRTWHTTLKAGNYARDELKYETHIVDTPVEAKTIVSTAGPVTIDFPAQDAGVYIIEASSWDRLGRAQIVQMDTFVHGDSPVTWERPEDRRFTAKLVESSYKPGQTAKIVLESPFQTAEAIAIVEAPGKIKLIHTSVRNGTGTVHIPVEETWCPEIPVNILIMRGRIQGSRLDAATGIDLGKPQTLGTAVTLRVSKEKHQLNIDVNHPKRARPGETIQLSLKLTDDQNRPVSGEAAVWLVDRAVLALGREYTLNPLDDFLKPWPSRARIRDTREFTLGQLPWIEKTGGGMGMSFEAASLFDRQTLRKKFKAVPFYRPFVHVGSDGTANLSIELPDNLTQFAVRVKASSGVDRFGYSASRLAVSLPVVIQPTLPRFLRPGDQFDAIGVSRLVEGDSVTGTVAVAVDGLAIDGSNSVPVSLDLNTPVRTDFSINVPEAQYDERGMFKDDEVTIRMAVERTSDKVGDAVEVKLPVKDGARMWKTTTIKTLQQGKSMKIPGVNSDDVRPGSSSRQLHLSNSPLINLAMKARSQLMLYPYECTEQRVSRAEGLLALRAMHDILGMSQDPDLDLMINRTVQSIGASVTPEGLISFWPGGKGYVHLTARVVRFLAAARMAGYAVDPVIIERLTATLKKALRSDNPYLLSDFKYTERCMALESLQLMGHEETAYLEELARFADGVGLESQARITRLLYGLDGVSPERVEALSKRVMDDVIFETIDGEVTATALRRTCQYPFVMQSDITTLAEIVRMMMIVHPDDPRIDSMIRGLLNMVSSQGLTTYLSESLIRLVREYFSVFDAVNQSEFLINDKVVSIGDDRQLMIITDDGLSDVTIQHISGKPVIVSSESIGYPRLLPGQLPESADGFAVNRSWRQVDSHGKTAEKINWKEPGTTLTLTVGDIIEEEIQIVNAENRNFVVIEIPLAAGMEPLNPQLATAPPEAEPDGEVTMLPEYLELRDDHVAYYYNTLPRGTYSFYFRTRAAFEGTFSQPGAWAALMYNPEETGGSAGAYIAIKPAE